MHRKLGVAAGLALGSLATYVWTRARQGALRAPTALLLGIGAVGTALLVPTVFGKPWRIEHLYARALLHYVLDHPLLLSRLRLLDRMGLRGYEARLDDYSVAFVRKECQRSARYVEILRTYDRDSLRDELSYDIMLEFLGDPELTARFAFHDFKAVNHIDGAHVVINTTLLEYHRLDDLKGAHHYIARLRAVRPTFEALADQLRHRAERGIIPPRLILTRCIAQLRRMVTSTPEENELFERFEAGVEGLAMKARRRANLLRQAREAVDVSVDPGVEMLAKCLEELREQASEDAGVWRLPDGDVLSDSYIAP